MGGLGRRQDAQCIEIDGLCLSLGPGQPRDQFPSPRDPNRVAPRCALDEFAQMRLRFGDSDLVHGVLVTIQ